MLLNLGDEQGLRDAFAWKKAFAGGLVFGILMEMIYAFIMQTGSQSIEATRATNIGTVEAIGNVIFTQLLFPFEVTSLLLTAAIVGAIVLAKNKID